MISNLFKVVMIGGVLLLSACSGVSTHSNYSEDLQPSAGFGPGPTNNHSQLSFHGSALGSSFGEYSSGLLHDD
ncbi:MULTISPECIES: hypothetical protein [unclassified Pseudomonas]|uniref:hypothetical protein n=1 Tax=unclassified Pseudomonas TaxID=196821 RepID=UPI0002706602|nr:MULTISPECIES: hypothetical protein [unclassified Pseudomonas]EJM83107.1 hypothetical protein PMI32_02364 [Pseudomonas sp. GM60]